MDFKEFLNDQIKRKKLSQIKMDFAQDVLRDKTFSEKKTWAELKNYLRFKNASPKVLAAGKLCWESWQHFEKNKPLPVVDGLGPKEKLKLRNAIRQVWHRSTARRLCVARCTDAEGYSFCENCKKRKPKIKIDHVNPVGEVDSGFIERMFVPSKDLQGLCDDCHKPKTKKDNAKTREKKKARAKPEPDFY